MDRAGLTTPQRLGQAVRNARLDRRMTQVELAEAAGVSRRWLITFESGKGLRAELNSVLAVIRALGLDLRLAGSAPDLPPLADQARALILEEEE